MGSNSEVVPEKIFLFPHCKRITKKKSNGKKKKLKEKKKLYILMYLKCSNFSCFRSLFVGSTLFLFIYLFEMILSMNERKM